MKSNAYEHELLQAVKALAVIAKAAYWETTNHCGGTFAPACEGTFCYAGCKAIDELEGVLGRLEAWSC